MKKFITTMIILIMLAGAVFCIGWAQLGVPTGAYGVLQSKTHGLDPHPLQSGEFRWLWYKLIPTNVSIAVFRLNPVRQVFSAANTLPSGAAYAAFAGSSADFSWELSASLSFSLRPQSLVDLVAANSIGSQEELTHYETELAGQIEAFILGRVNSADKYERQLEDLLTSGSSPDLERDIMEQFPAIAHCSCAVKAVRFPDFALYRQLRSLYEEHLARLRENSGDLGRALGQRANSVIDRKLRFEELEQYGALLTKYPILLQYLALDGKNGE